MCPQPLSKFDQTGSYVLTNQGMTRKPMLGALVAEAISSWAMIEAFLGDTFAAMIGARVPVTMEMFTAIQSPELRQIVFIAAAKEVLPKRYVRMAEALLRTFKPLAEHRHKFAHWLWGVSPVANAKLEDALLLVEPRRHWENMIAAAKHWRPRRAKARGFASLWATHPTLNPDFIYVYRESELWRICSQMEVGFRNAEIFGSLVASKPSQRRALYRQLSRDTDIQTALHLIQKNERKARRLKPNKS